MMPIIDVHAHLVPPRDVMTRLLRKSTVHAVIPEILNACPDWGYRVEQKILDADVFAGENHIQKTFLIPFDFLGRTNLLLMDTIQDHPLFSAMACVDISGHENMNVQIRKIKKSGFSGIKLYPLWGPLSEPLYHPLYERAMEHKLPILTHSGESMFKCVKPQWSHPRLIEQIAGQYPELVIIMAHGGHPYYEDAVWALKRQSNLYMDISARGMAVLFRLWRDSSVSLENKTLLFHKVLFGTDFFHPVIYGDEKKRLDSMIENLHALNLPETAMRRICSENAQTLFPEI